MNSNDNQQQLGKLSAQVEDLREDMSEIRTRLATLDELVRTKFTVAETLINTVKFTGLTIVAILTLHFGDIPKWWSHFFR